MIGQNRLRRQGIVGLAGVVVAGAIVAFGSGEGHPAENVRMLSGTAWVSSSRVGQLTLIDGTSAEVSAQVQVAPAGNLLEVVQHGSTAYAIDQSAGTVRRVDGATFGMTQPETPIPDANTGLTAIPGPDALYTLDTRRGVLTETDPRTLARRGGNISLATQLAAGTTTVDNAGRLWAIDNATGDLVRIAGGKRSVTSRVTQPGKSVLALAGGAPVVVDTNDRKAIAIDPETGKTSATLAIDLRPEDTVAVSGSPHASRLYLVIGRGALAICDLRAGACDDNVVPLNSGSQLGAAVEAGNRLFIPDYTTGQVLIVDLTENRVVARPTVLAPAGKFQLLTRDGVVFFNDPDSARAGVVRLDGTVQNTAKYDANDPGRGVHKPDTQPGPQQTPNQQPNQQPNDKPDQKPNNPDQRPTNQPNQPQPNPSDPQQPQQPDPGDTERVQLQVSVSKANPVVNERITLRVSSIRGPEVEDADWNFDDGNAGKGVSVDHQWTVAKTYHVSVQARLRNGRTAATTVDITVTAKPTITLSVNVPEGGGTITGNGISCPDRCVAEFDPGQQVTLTATPDAQHLLGTWSGACGGAEETCDLVMDANKTVGYQFRTVDPTITYTITKPSGGSITINGVTCPSICTYKANRGQNVSLKADGGDTHNFTAWITGCANKNVAECTISSETDMTIAATFTLKKFRLTLQWEEPAGNGGDAEVNINNAAFATCRAEQPSCTYDIDAGTQVTLIARTRGSGLKTARWTGDCQSNQGSCALTMNKAKNVTVFILED